MKLVHHIYFPENEFATHRNLHRPSSPCPLSKRWALHRQLTTRPPLSPWPPVESSTARWALNPPMRWLQSMQTSS